MKFLKTHVRYYLFIMLLAGYHAFASQDITEKKISGKLEKIEKNMGLYERRWDELSAKLKTTKYTANEQKEIQEELDKTSELLQKLMAMQDRIYAQS